jgi:8-oxo-dGTP pyrophosphatase MutT (NUDIX family)|tara:strand:- start:1276 stop:1716 length:441 start_codon:yes stop_codon:yes gene_type:complete
MFNINEIKHKNENLSQAAMVVILDPKDRVLILKRPGDLKAERFPNKWCLAGGGGLEGETPKENAIRETLEETGIKIELKDLYYLLNKQDGDKKYFFFYARTNKQPKIMNVLDEHEEFKWVRADEIDNYDMIKDTQKIIKMALRSTM